jgi:outer membrane protein
MSQHALRSTLCLKAWGLALLVAAGAAQAATTPVSSEARPVSEEVPLQVKDGAVLLSVDEAVEIALQRNLGLIVERYNRTQSRLGIEQNLGIYDLVLNGIAEATDNTSPTASALQSSQSSSRTFNFGVSQLVPTGGTLSLGIANGRNENNNSFSSINPFYTTSATFILDQPLLQRFGRASTDRNLLVARSQSDASRQEFERQVEANVEQVLDAYWSLVGAREQLVVAQESLDLAKELHGRNRIQVDVGTMAPLELVQSEAAIASREEDIITAQSAVGDAEDVLRRLLNLPFGELWSAEIRPVTNPETKREPLNLDEAIQQAVASRPELKSQQLVVDQARIQAAYFKNQVKPSLDLHVEYGTSGIGGNIIFRDPDTGEITSVLPGGYSDAFNQATGFNFTGWTARLTFGLPLQNRAAKTQSTVADLEVQRAQAVYDQLRQQIIADVRQSARRVDTAAKSIDAAKASRQFQEKNLDAQKKRYENGMSTSFEITRIQEDVTTARSSEVAAIVNYRTALAQFYRVTGRLLEVENVQLEDKADTFNRWTFHLWPLRSAK